MEHKIGMCIEKDAERLCEIIRRSFRDVADRFGLTPENAPRHPSNCTEEWIRDEIGRGTAYFVLEIENHAVGCVALQQADPEVCYLERLAVLPEYRRRGFGEALVSHVLSEAKKLGATRVEIGIIAEHTELKDWYEKLGFIETASRTFPHLPFTVCFLSKMLS
jgi:N-acetylglutamate synthase-like GNAT family acetyltransferase